MIDNFTKSVKTYVKNPIGIIALFIVLIYSIASLIFSFGMENLKTQSERLPFIYFLIIFPILVLLVFLFLVIKHHSKLYGPGDFGSDESFLKVSGFSVDVPKEIKEGKVSILTSGGEKNKHKNYNDQSIDKLYKELVDFGFCLLHESEVVRQRTAYKSGKYRARVWIEPIMNKSLNKIKSVTYRVWEDFDEKKFLSTNSKKKFDLWMNIDGEFPILAQIELINGKKIILQRYIDLPGRPE